MDVLSTNVSPSVAYSITIAPRQDDGFTVPRGLATVTERFVATPETVAGAVRHAALHDAKRWGFDPAGVQVEFAHGSGRIRVPDFNRPNVNYGWIVAAEIRVRKDDGPDQHTHPVTEAITP